VPSSAGTAVAAPRLALDRHANPGQLRERRKRYRKAQGDGANNGTRFLTLSDRPKWIEAMRPVWNDFGKTVPGAADLIRVIQRT